MGREQGSGAWRAGVSALAAVLALAGMVALGSSSSRLELEQSERAQARSLGLPSSIDPDRATGVDFADRHALGSWLAHTGLKDAKPAAPQHAAALKQLHELSMKKRAAMKMAPARTQQLTNSGVPALPMAPVPGTITVPAPPGFSIRTGKKITGVLDVAAPLDPDTGAAGIG